MRMLSRVAERLFWMARYLERAEDTARIINAYNQFVLDTPKGTEPGWDTLINIVDGQYNYHKRYSVINERNIIKFLVADDDNGSSIRMAIKAARENVRTTRDVLPEEAWELMNELYLFSEESCEKALTRRYRYQYLDAITLSIQQLNGLFESSLCRDHAHTFIQLGNKLERADMVSRVIDVGVHAIKNTADDALSDISTTSLWVQLLKSLSAYSAYRRQVGPLMDINEIVNFVFTNEEFPRSLKYCLDDLFNHTKLLNNNEATRKQILGLKRMLSNFDANLISLNDLHAFIDRFQAKLNNTSASITDTWFLQ